MILWTAIFALFAIVSVGHCEDRNVSIPVTFRKVGTFATGLHYGHVALTLDLGRFDRYVLEGMKLIETALTPGKHYYEVDNERMLAAKKMFEGEIWNALNQFRRLVSDPRSLENQIVREKRQIIELLSGATSLLGLGLSLFNMQQVKVLSREVDSQRKNIVNLYAAVQYGEKVTRRLEKTTRAVNNTLFSFIDQYENDMSRVGQIIRAEHAAGMLVREVDLMINALTRLFQGGLDPHLLNYPYCEHAFADLKRQADEQHLSPLFSEYGWILNSPHSFYLEDQKLRLFVHVPFYSNSLLPFYKFLNVPMTHEGIEAEKTVMQISEAREFLAIDFRTGNGKVMTKAEVDDCKKFQLKDEVVYVCEEGDLLENDVSKTCLGGLMKGIFDFEKLKEICDLTLVRPKNVAHVLSRTELLIFHSRLERIRSECADSRDNNMQEFSGLRKIKVKPGCKLLSPDFTFVAGIGIDYEANETTWQFDVRQVTANTGMAWTDVFKVADQILEDGPLGEVTLTDLSNQRFKSIFDAFLNVCVISALILALGSTGTLGFLYYRFKKSKAAAKTEPSVAFHKTTETLEIEGVVVDLDSKE